MHKNQSDRNLLDDEVGRRVDELSREIGLTPSELMREALDIYTSSPRRIRPFAETKLAKELRAIRKRIVQARTPLLDADGVMREVAEVRGERGE